MVDVRSQGGDSGVVERTPPAVWWPAYCFLVGIVGVGCSSSSTEPTGLQPSVAVVYGQVMTSEGDVVPDASVRAMIYSVQSGGCTDEDGWLAGTDTTDTEGDYSILGAYLHFGRIDMCVVLEVRPPEGSGLTTARVTGGEVEFIHQGFTPPIDSLRVDVVLTPDESECCGTSP